MLVWIDAIRRGDVRAVEGLLAGHGLGRGAGRGEGEGGLEEGGRGRGRGRGAPSTDANAAATSWFNSVPPPLSAPPLAAWAIANMLSQSLVAACEAGHLDVVELLLAAGADASDNPPHALLMACCGGHLRIVERLLAAGANVQRAARLTDPDDEEPTGVLEAASRRGYVGVVERLIVAGALVAMEDDANTSTLRRNRALQRACENGHLAVVQRLVEAEPALNQDQVSTLLPVACGSRLERTANVTVNTGHVHILDWLLERGADVYADNDRALFSACRFGNPAVVARLAAAYDPARAPNNVSRFRWACAVGDVNAVGQLLASHDATLDKNESMLAGSMRLAAGNGQVAVVARLLQLGAHIFNGNPEYHAGLDDAAARGQAAVVELLLHAGASLHQRKWALGAAVRGGHVETVDRILAPSDRSRVLAPESPGLSYDAPDDFLTEAVVAGNLAILDRLLRAGGASERDANLALCVACELGHVAIVSRLLDASVSVHTQNHYVDHRTRSRIEAMNGDILLPSHEYVLVSASRAGHLDVVECLLAAGASVHAHAPNRTTPLMAACLMGHLAVVERLLAAGADVHAHDDAVLLAVYRGDLELAEDLLSREPSAAASVIAADTADFDAPIYLANMSGNTQLVETLLRHGADARRIWWDCLDDSTWPRLVTAVPGTMAATLPEPVKPVWVRFHLRLRARLRPALQRARDHLDRPPRSELGVAAPTRAQLIAHLSMAGRRFAREYWTDGIPLFFPDLQSELGSVPDEFQAPAIGSFVR